MSRYNLGSKQTLVLHNCLFQNERHDLVLTPQKQTIGYIRSKRQTRKKAKIAKQKQTLKWKFLKAHNAISESDTTTKQEPQELKGSIDKKTQ